MLNEVGKTVTTIQSATDALAPGELKRAQLKRYLKPLMIYGGTIFFNAALSFATFALLTHHLTEVDYGVINLYNSFIYLLMPFIGIGVPFVLSVDYFKMDKAAFSKQFTNALLIPLAAFLLWSVASLLLHSYIEHFTKVNFLFASTAALSCLLLVLNDIILSLLRNQEKYKLFASFSVGKNLIETGLALMLIIGMGFGWAGRLGSNLLTLLLCGLIIVLLINKWGLIRALVDKKVIVSLLLAGLPFIPERLALFTMGYSDRFFIDYFSGTADVGYYSAGAQMAMVVNLSILTLNNTFYPKLFRGLSREEVNKREIRRVIWMYLGISAFITLAVVSIVPFFFRYFIGPNFQPGQIYAIYLAIGFFFWSVYNVFLAFLLNMRRNKLIMRISLFGMLLSLTFNFINVKSFGALGATYTSIIVYFSMAVLSIYFVNRQYGLKRILL